MYIDGAFANFKCSAHTLFVAVAHEALERLGGFKSQEGANMVWGFAIVHRFTPKFCDAAAHETLERVADFNSQYVANIVWALATLNLSAQ